MNDLTLIGKNLFRKPVRTVLLLASIFVAFLILCVLASFDAAVSNLRAAPNRMVTLNKVNFTETLPIAYYGIVAQVDGVAAATHMNWFGGYYRDQRRGLLPTFATDPETYLQVYAEDVRLTAPQREAFLRERDAMIVGRVAAERFGWREGERIPLRSNIFTRVDGSEAWSFRLVAIFEPPPNSTQGNSAIIRYDYFNEAIALGRDRISWIAFLTASTTDNDRVANAIDARFANSADATSTQDAASLNRAFIAQFGNIALVIVLVVGAAFVAILLIVGTTMALAVRERTREMGVMKTLGFSSLRMLGIVLGESVLLSLLGAMLAVLATPGLLALLAAANGGALRIPLAWPAIGLAFLIALGLGLVTGLAPASFAYRLRIHDALGRR